VILLLHIILLVLLLLHLIRLISVSRWVLYAKYDTLAEQYCSSAKAFNVVTQSITDILAEVRKELDTGHQSFASRRRTFK
jgi:hypothetical protein